MSQLHASLCSRLSAWLRRDIGVIIADDYPTREWWRYL
jgi:hypothetical protein